MPFADAGHPHVINRKMGVRPSQELTLKIEIHPVKDRPCVYFQAQSHINQRVIKIAQNVMVVRLFSRTLDPGFGRYLHKYGIFPYKNSTESY